MTMTQNGVFTSMMASAKTHFHLLVEVFLICSLLTARADTVTNTWWDNSPHGKFHHAEELIKGVDFQGSNVVRDVSAGVKLLQEVVIDTEGSVSNLDARADALHWLGYCHYVGMGVPKDQAKAVELFAKAGEKGKCWAMTDLAMCHAFGTGVPQDKSKAVALFERAVKEGFSADKGTSDAYYIRMASLLGDNSGIAHVARNNLALCQMIGFGCPTNMARAAQLLGIAERQFTTSEQGLLAAYYFAKLGDKKTAGEILSERIEKLSGANIEDAREELGNDVWIKRFVVPCDELLSEMAEAGVAGAKEQLCLRLFAGDFMDRDVKRAFSIFRELPKTKNRLWVLTGLFDMTVINFPQDQVAVIAMSEQMADNGDSDIAHWLGGVYLKGVGAIPVNPQKGVSYVAKAAAGGLAVAQFDLGCLYCYGMHGLPPDIPRGIQLCETAATNGYTDAWLALGLIHAEGEIIPKDLSKGVAYMRRGAEAGDARSQYLLARAYFYGEGIEKDLAKAKMWIQTAADNGYLPAQEMIRENEDADSP